MAESKSSPEVIDAEATVIDTDITALSASQEWLAQINERAELLAEQYKPHDITGEQDYKDSKKARADANREIKAIEQERMNMTAAIKRAVREFEDGTKRAIEPLTLIVRQYDEKRDAYETRWTNERIAAIREAYEDFAPDIALPQEGAEEALVPFHRLLGRYGNEKKTGWTLRSVGEAKAIEAMQAAVEEIAKAEKTIDSMVEEAYREGAKARYFRTLDLQATLNEEAEAKAQRERVARLERERQERMAAEEAARRQAEEDAWLEQAAVAPVEPGHMRIVAPPSYAEEATVLDNLDGAEPLVPPEPVRIEPAPTMVEVPIVPPDPEQFEPSPVAYEPPRIITPTEVPHPWVISIPSATKTQAQAVADFMKANGIAFERIYSGDMAQAYAKWSNENAR